MIANLPGSYMEKTHFVWEHREQLCLCVLAISWLSGHLIWKPGRSQSKYKVKLSKYEIDTHTCLSANSTSFITFDIPV